ASYYVKAELTSGSLSPASNTVSAAVEDVGQVEKMTVTNNNEYEISLNNYPNPFNPSTTIEYSVTEESFIRLEVFNLLGKQVLTLVDKKQQPGTYEVKFDGTNLPSGLYLYKLTANEKIVTKKMLLLR
ncbi:MAG: T9SS type A sorting domain-containing protein, partial [Melioribacteraceae bacterium]|nr:T9SS type A sorting domain-containing protein [Melioribacteraceae bacterium]